MCVLKLLEYYKKMKNKNPFFYLLVFSALFYAANLSAQPKLGFTYQAVAVDVSKSQALGRDSQGEILANQNIDLRFSILEGSENGPMVYQETHETTTDIFGIFRLIVGRGVNLSGNNLEDLNWGIIAYFLQVEIDLGSGYEILGIEELLGSPYALNSSVQLLELSGDELAISKGNTVTLQDNDPTNELVQNIAIGGSILTITDAGGDNSVDLAGLVSADNSISNELQTITKNGSTVTLSDGGGSFTDEVNDADSDPTNEIQNISTDGSAGNITLTGGATLVLNVNDADSDPNNEIELPATATVNQVLKWNGASWMAGSDEVNDADSDPTNEIQDLQLTGNDLEITNNATPTAIDLSPYLDAAFATTANVTSNAPGDYTTDDFVFGSSQLDDNGNTNNDARMFFDKSKGAFRAGIVNGTEWDDVNRGPYSTAMGFGTTASGWGSTATGQNTIASATSSTALGSNTVASGLSSVAVGSGAVASANYSIAIGVNPTASGARSIALGWGTIASGSSSTSMGLQTYARSYAETSLGMFNTDYTPNSATTYDAADRIFVIGNGTDVVNRSDALIVYKNGNATLAGLLTQLSDMRLKKGIAPLNQSLTKLTKLRGVHYKWNDVKPHDMESLQTGLIAQEVEKILPELVNKAADGYKSVNYIGLIPHLIEAVKELDAKYKQLQEQSNEKIKDMEERLVRLEKLVEGK